MGFVLLARWRRVNGDKNLHLVTKECCQRILRPSNSAYLSVNCSEILIKKAIIDQTNTSKNQAENQLMSKVRATLGAEENT